MTNFPYFRESRAPHAPFGSSASCHCPLGKWEREEPNPRKSCRRILGGGPEMKAVGEIRFLRPRGGQSASARGPRETEIGAAEQKECVACSCGSTRSVLKC